MNRLPSTVGHPGNIINGRKHLVALELGGSNSLRNLWPESYWTRPINAHVKDRLENRLHKLVCTGKLGLPEAQKAIAEDWIGAYRTYVGPLPE